jgi:hypothetical protein
MSEEDKNSSSWELPAFAKDFAWKFQEYFEGQGEASSAVQSVFKHRS